MNIKKKTWWIAAAVCFLLFLGLTASVLWIDVAPVATTQSEIGLSTLNLAVRDAVGTNETWYKITELLGYLSIASAAGIALIGAYQLALKKKFSAVDRDLYCAAGAYGAVAAFYVVFELVVINYRPILMGAEPEASFPSSHTMLTVALMGVAIHQLSTRISSQTLRVICAVFCSMIAAVTTAGRMLAGVHWITDIVGGVLLGLAIFFAYLGAVSSLDSVTKNTINND